MPRQNLQLILVQALTIRLALSNPCFFQNLIALPWIATAYCVQNAANTYDVGLAAEANAPCRSPLKRHLVAEHRLQQLVGLPPSLCEGFFHEEPSWRDANLHVLYVSLQSKRCTENAQTCWTSIRPVLHMWSAMELVAAIGLRGRDVTSRLSLARVAKALRGKRKRR